LSVPASASEKRSSVGTAATNHGAAQDGSICKWQLDPQITEALPLAALAALAALALKSSFCRDE